MARIILIDDEHNLRHTLSRLLVREGHEVVEGGSFAEVERHLRPGQFDLLICDILMPDFDGLQVLREVVERRGCREPVVLVTGQPSLESASEAVRRGAFDYFSKPVTKDKLLEGVARGLRHVELLRDRDRARQQEVDLLKNLAILGQETSLLTHEIRTPITSLRHALAAVAEKLGVEERVVVENLVRNIQRIEKLLTQTLSFARPLDLDLERVDLAQLCRESVAQLDGFPPRGGLVVEVDDAEGPVEVEVDRDRVAEILVNLVRNACEACGGQGGVTLTVRSGSNTAVVDVSDTGPGVPPKMRGEIFRLFQSSKSGGTGIGLAFSRKIAESHGGSLDLVDGAGPGARFRLKLPQRSAAAPKNP